MSKPFSEPPPEWSPLQPLQHVGGATYIYLGEGVTPGGTGAEVIVYHWHTPTTEGLEHRWLASYCGNHTVVSVEPLTMTASLACGDGGCQWHGWITDGRWVDA